GDDRLRDLGAQISFRVGLQLLQDEGRDLLRRVLLIADGHLVVGAHVALDGQNRALRIEHRLPLGGGADQELPIRRESDGRRGRAAAFRVRNDDRLAALHHRYDRVSRSQVNADNLAHGRASFPDTESTRRGREQPCSELFAPSTWPGRTTLPFSLYPRRNPALTCPAGTLSVAASTAPASIVCGSKGLPCAASGSRPWRASTSSSCWRMRLTPWPNGVSSKSPAAATAISR